LAEKNRALPENPATGEVSYAILLGMIALLVFSLILTFPGLPLRLAVLPASCMAIGVSLLFLRRKHSLRETQQGELAQAKEVEAIARRVEHLYTISPVAVITLEMTSWTVQRASRGFTNLLGLDPETKLAGTRLAALLKAQTSQMDALEAHLRDSSPSGPIQLTCFNAEGRALDLFVSGRMMEPASLAELVFVADLGQFLNDHDLEERAEEMESFRKMMMRRETRILELKSEVNRLLVGSRSAPRYEIDSDTADNRIQELTHRKKES
jgi:hypothetical protein